MATEITFRGWRRPAITSLVTGAEQGRARGQAGVTLQGTDAAGQATGSRSAQLAFLLAGPGDITGIEPAAFGRRFPPPDATSAETTKCPYLEVSDPALPWQHTPEANPAGQGRRLRPWLILLCGTSEEISIDHDQATLAPAVLAAHPPTDSYRWAHVQEGGGQVIARLLSPRPLAADSDCVAALVPGYAVGSAGTLTDAWSPTATSPVVLPVYAHWRFRTGPGGDFRTLATRLKPGAAAAGTGRAPLAYPRVAAAELSVRGALAPVGSSAGDPPLPSAVASDLAGLRTPATDPVGRPVVGLPTYGTPWHPDPDATAWGGALNGDPRHRAVAGLGLRLGVDLQDELAAEAERQAGALAEAAQRLRDLSAGRAAAGSLWARRLPAEPARRLWLLGPAMRRVVTPAGPVAALLTAADRPQPPGWFSTAAWRVLRRGPARTALALPEASDPAKLQDAANRCPPRAPFREVGLPALERIGARDFEQRRRAIVAGGPAASQPVVDVLDALDLDRFPRHREDLEAVRRRAREAVAQGRPLPRVRLAVLLAALGTGEEDRGFDDALVTRLLRELADGFDQLADDRGVVVDLLDGLGDRPEEPPPCRPLDLTAVAGELGGLFDPTSANAPAVRQVLTGISGLDPAQPLTPPEICQGIILPMWRHLADREPDWMLPGVGQLPEDAVIAGETNPAFSDAFLAGLNTRLLEELRWRNIRVASGCTPLRAFWSRRDPVGGTPVADVTGVHLWGDATALGAAQHRPGALAGQDLVLIFRTRLLERYPGTVFWLVSARHPWNGTGPPDFTTGPDPAAARLLPTFQGRLGPDVMYFGFQGLPSTEVTALWLVLEDAPVGYRFRNDQAAASAAADGASFADLAFDNPIRVLIRGDRLTPGGTP
jgi:hypothetical protein